MLVLAAVSGCAAPARESPARGPARAPSDVAAADPSAPPPALVGGVAVPWRELAPLLAEAAGGVVLEEIALDRVVAREAARRGVAVTEADVEAERGLLLETLALTPGGAPDDNAASRLLAEVRRQRGLGKARFDSLLRRSATLRKLVSDSVAADEEAVRLMHALAHGEKRLVRIVTVDTPREASVVVERLRAGEPFGEIAARFSTDTSAQRGGLIEPLSTADPAYPQALRTAVSQLAPGQTSEPIAIDNAVAVVRLEEVVPGTGRPLEDVRPEMERAARLRAQRLRMDDLAARMLASAGVTVLDPALRQSWQWRRGQAE